MVVVAAVVDAVVVVPLNTDVVDDVPPNNDIPSNLRSTYTERKRNFLVFVPPHIYTERKLWNHSVSTAHSIS